MRSDAGIAEHPAALLAGRVVHGQPPRAADVPGRHRRRPLRGLPTSMPSRRTSTSAIASTDGVRRDSTRHRERIVTDTSSGWVGRRAEQEDGVRRRLLDGLEQRVRRALGEPVGVLDEHDLPAARRGPAGGELHDRAHLPDRDGQPLGRHGPDVGVRPVQHGAAMRRSGRSRGRRTPARRRTPGRPPTVRSRAGR